MQETSSISDPSMIDKHLGALLTKFLFPEIFFSTYKNIETIKIHTQDRIATLGYTYSFFYAYIGEWLDSLDGCLSQILYNQSNPKSLP